MNSLAWTYLLLAGMLEVACTTALRYVDGFNRSGPILLLIVLGASSLGFLYKALDTIPIGTAYAVWTGLGAAGTVLVGILIFKEPSDLWRLVFLATLIGSIVGLRYVSQH
jgi:quaternary ammonium compound-resistance protein SugE